ncbi:SBBP repeat-containing protein [Pontibacter sp. KCTC 32443]|uniref:outer membrane protein assembly factor BamB family protein n=1 Tax=Pontibacter TaxID=323449 RepID=UPI00164EAA43|nr:MULTISPECIES: PQQ-binding-like beta-propeller repeat protein [Pontibacter]MBC5774904.1 SBBP repeat-containing protein [Pontibacter sp. KCTC 32443]
MINPLVTSAQEVKQEWARQYMGRVTGDIRPVPIPDTDSTSSIHLAVDADGNSFVTAISFDSLFNRVHIVTAKFSPAGEELWANHYVSPFRAEVNGIAVDSSGNVYIVGSDDAAGFTRGSLLVVKYNGSDGTQLWVKTQSLFPGTRGRRILVDQNGDILTIGFSPIGFRIYFLSKFSSTNGELLWTNNITESGIKNDFDSLLNFEDYVLDINGDVYLTGALHNSASGIDKDVLTIKMSGVTGEQIWRQNFETQQLYRIMGIALDTSGGVYVSASNAAGSAESILLKYNAATGEQYWTSNPVVSGDPVSGIANLVVSSAEELFSSGIIGGTNYILKYNTDTGSIIWSSPHSGTIFKLDTDKTRDVYAISNHPRHIYTLSKYAASTGVNLWEQTGSTALGYSYTTIDFEVNEIGEVAVAGLSTEVSTGLTGVFIAKHETETGTQLWHVRFEDSLNTNDRPTYLTTDGVGNIYVSGMITPFIGGSSRPVTVKYSPEGEELSDDFPGLIEGRNVFDDAGDLYVLGTRVGGDGRTELMIRKVSGDDASVIWTVIKGGGFNTPQFIKADNEGGIFITGTLVHPAQPGLTTIFLQKYNAADGTLLWEVTFSDFFTAAELSSIADIEVDAAGDIYVAGVTAQPMAAMQDVAVIKLSGTDGSRLWKQVYNSGASDRVNELAVDEADGVYILGFTDVDDETRKFYIVKYDSPDGSQLLYQELIFNGSPVIEASSLVADNFGNVYLRGSQLNDQLGSSEHVFKVNTIEPIVSRIGEIQSTIDYILIDGIGGVYVPNLINGDIRVTKYSTDDGSKVWEIIADTDADRPLFTLDKDNNVIIAGAVLNQISGFDFLAIKYSQESGEGEPCYLPLTVQLSLPPHAVQAGETVLSTARFGGYILGDVHNIRWVWGDNTAPVEAYFATGDDHITGEHKYEQAGIYRVSLDFSESCLVPESYDFEEWVVIYDPGAGSVTGGGQINSPQAAFPWMSQQLNAQYSLNIKYNKATDTTPQGQMQLNLRQQGVFRSSNIEWLVVSGDQAVWQGTGTLSGKGNYGFIASGRDAGGTGTDDTGDQLRIRIWDLNAGNTVVYDNFQAAGDIYDMSTAAPNIARGQIIIHGAGVAAKQTAKVNNVTGKQAAFYNYPNIFTDKTTITFSLEQAGNYTLEVYDMKGKLVKTLSTGRAEAGRNYSYELDGSELQKGIYIARLIGDKGSYSIKMVLQR